jgi:hypothetical protein
MLNQICLKLVVTCEYGDDEPHGAHGGTHPMMQALAEAQPTHPEIVILSHRAVHHVHPKRSCCA